MKTKWHWHKPIGDPTVPDGILNRRRSQRSPHRDARWVDAQELWEAQ